MARSPVWLAAMGLSTAAAGLVVVNAGLILWVQSEATSVAQRRDFLAQTPQLARVVQLVAGGLAQAAIRDKDEAIRTLLSSNGITLPAPAGPAPTP